MFMFLAKNSENLTTSKGKINLDYLLNTCIITLYENQLNPMELVAPAGNLNKLQTAFAFGADAVYCGIADFSLRVRINQFELPSVREAIGLAHSLGKKIYLTVNIYAHNRHLPALEKHLAELGELLPDGFIVSDPGIFSILRKNCPGVKIHLSTQANCTNWQAVKFWHELGVSRIILGREVTLAEIKEIHEKVPAVELECFVHGAMCMSYSGRCLLSKYYTDRSANLGDCTQPCRWKFKAQNLKSKVNSELDTHHLRFDSLLYLTEEARPEQLLELDEDEHGSYIMNSKDLCLVEYLSELKQAGVHAVKIEGRAKSVYYVGNTVKVYRSAINDLIGQKTHDKSYYSTELKKALNRGFTTGFLFGQDQCEQNFDNCHEECEWEFCGQVTDVPASRCLASQGGQIHSTDNTDYRQWEKQVRTRRGGEQSVAVTVHNQIFKGDEVELVVPRGENVSMAIEKMFNEKGEEISEAHGGQGSLVWLAVKENLPERTLVRRKTGKEKV